MNNSSLHVCVRVPVCVCVRITCWHPNAVGFSTSGHLRAHLSSTVEPFVGAFDLPHTPSPTHALPQNNPIDTAASATQQPTASLFRRGNRAKHPSPPLKTKAKTTNKQPPKRGFSPKTAAKGLAPSNPQANSSVLATDRPPVPLLRARNYSTNSSSHSQPAAPAARRIHSGNGRQPLTQA